MVSSYSEQVGVIGNTHLQRGAEAWIGEVSLRGDGRPTLEPRSVLCLLFTSLDHGDLASSPSAPPTALGLKCHGIVVCPGGLSLGSGGVLEALWSQQGVDRS